MGERRAPGRAALWAAIATLGAGAVGACVAAVAVDPAEHAGDGAGAGQGSEGGADSGSGDPPDAATCGAPATACGGACVRLDGDSSHCGACDRACAAGEVCSGGACTAACEPGLVACGGGCVFLGSDAQNCGACGNACGPQERCMASACVAQVCTSECARGGCVDTDRDVHNCGGCDVACGPGELCSGGGCVGCPPGAELCPLGCADLRADPLNCGFCERTCGAAQLCIDGVCRGACVDDSMEDNDRLDAAVPIAWSRGSSVSHGGFLCSGDEDWFRYETASLGLFQPILSVRFVAKGSEEQRCVGSCERGTCWHDVPAGPQHTVTVEVYNAVTRSLVASGTSGEGRLEIGAFGPELKQDILVRVVGPASAEYPYQLSVSVWENNGEEDECEC
jgi:hypothetical protein